MPHPENRPAFRIEGDLGAMRVWQVIEENRSVKIACDNCSHETLWTPLFMKGRLARKSGFTMVRLASRLRCAGCRSNYLRIWRG